MSRRTKVTAIICPKCNWAIYSVARYDCHSCPCGDCFADGGFDYLRYGYNNLVPIARAFFIEATKRELYDDWNFSLNKPRKFGTISPDEVKRRLKRREK